VQILLTVLATIIGGAVTLALGQIAVRGAIEPALELKRLIGTIAFDLDYHANKFSPGSPTEQEWRDIFRKHSCSLREKLNLIVWYAAFAWLLHFPSRQNVALAAAELMGHSNRRAQAMEGELGGRETEIKRLLNIKT
jgi:hypothetical protein